MGKNYAFIDAQNLHMAIENLGWKVDYLRFRKYLKEHYKIEKAYMFMGFKPTEQQLYGFLLGERRKHPAFRPVVGEPVAS